MNTINKGIMIACVCILITHSVCYGQEYNENAYEEVVIEISGEMDFNVLVNRKTGEVDYVWQQDKWKRTKKNKAYWQKLYEESEREK